MSLIRWVQLPEMTEQFLAVYGFEYVGITR